ncbi:AzlD domain-containing protein [Haloarchaeobius sp. TZWWS8]|uniref:AzlD domain-containing protein n=1 Tax=Haloarchaeobius sp. TZWWS8 TaxID=3446121 RepID=UPI003EBDF6D9
MTSYADGTVWTIIVAAGIGTFLIRLSFIFLLGRVDDVPDVVETVLRFVPAAVLAALVVPALVVTSGSVELASEPAELASALARTVGSFELVYEPAKVVAAAVAAAVAWRTEDVLATISVGMVTLWVVQTLV